MVARTRCRYNDGTRILDQVQSLPQLAAFEADLHVHAETLAGELGDAPESRDELAARDDRLRDELARIDAMAERVMRIRREHALAEDTAIATPTRKVFASTITSYDGRLEILEARARDVASRGGSMNPSDIADRVVEAARATLAVRAQLRDGVLALAAKLAEASASFADIRARDRRDDEKSRRAWSALRRELEATAARPSRVAEASLAARLATWPDRLDDPDPSTEPTCADMIELD